MADLLDDVLDSLGDDGLADEATAGEGGGDVAAEVVVVDPNTFTLAAPLALDVLALTKQMQLANGLRHENYSHYRAYCTRRLRRLRQSTKLLCGKSRRFVARPVRAIDVIDVRCLTLPLLNAERAWSFAMQLKQDNAEDRGNISRQRFHAIKRLRKAAKWAKVFKDLVDLCADDQTKLEAEAYASWMSGNAQMEGEHFAEALEDFIAAEAIYSHLAEATVRHRALFRTKVNDEVLKAIQYCKYNVARMEGSADAGDEVARRAALRLQSRGGLLLSANYAAVMPSAGAEAGAAGAAASKRPAEVQWRGHAIPLSDSAEVKWRGSATPLADAVMALIAEADEKMAAIGDATAAEAKLPQYVEMFGVYNEALALVEKISSTAAAKGQVKGEQQVVRLKLLEAFVKDLKLRRMMERTFLLFRSENETGQRAVRLFDTLLSLLSEIRALPDPPLDATRVVTALNSELDATQKQLEAWRCYHLGIAFTENAKLPEAIGLLRLGRSLAETASELHAARANVPGGSSRAVGARITALAEMDELQKLVRVQICLAHAGVVLAEEEAATSTPSYAAKTRATTEVGDAGDKMLLQRLRTWDGGSKTDQYGGASLPFRIFALPPPFEPVPARPLVFDIALNGMIVPSLDHRVPKRAQSKPKAKPRAAEEAPASAEEEEHEAAAGDEEGDKKGWFSSFWG